jgi:hypothetical protein
VSFCEDTPRAGRILAEEFVHTEAKHDGLVTEGNISQGSFIVTMNAA